MFKKILLVGFLFILILFPIYTQAITLEDQPINVYLFYSETCPHCKAEIEFLDELSKQDPNLRVHAFEITTNTQNADLLISIGRQFNLDISSVPFTMIGSSYFPGWSDTQEAKLDIQEAIDCIRRQECPDVLGNFLNSKNSTDKPTQNVPDTIKVPIFGEISTKNLSLPILTIVIGALDGFNPCAMWVLLFLISLLLGMQNRKKMWILGGSFIAASGIVYFLFLAAWLNIFLFLGVVFWVRIIIGIVAILSGYFSIKSYLKDRKGTCPITQGDRQQRIFDKLKNIVQQKRFIVSLIGIILLAFAVNLVELICSAGLPAVYTQVLSLSNLPPLQYYSYLILYIIIFMLDDIIIFTIAMLTLKSVAFTGKYSALSKIIGGIIILLLGILLISRPEWLMFS
ncbi:MAG: thioredoxin family protein [Patescibacteria group bacterium]